VSEAVRLGILGGTFDPVHLGHLAIAAAARDALGLERVLFVPAGDPWQKRDRPVTAASHRVAMIELAIAGEEGFECSRLEIDRAGPSYTVDTLEALAADERDAGRDPDLWLVLSTESLVGLPTWRDPERILDLARLAIVPRGTAPTHDPDGSSRPVADPAWVATTYPGREARFHFLDGPRIDLSSTGIRGRVAAGRSIDGLVPDAVAAYIGDHALYTEQPRRIDRP
jgi:nicotinate-nucleotide adenylyltransferase